MPFCWPTGAGLPAKIVVMAVGIRPHAELARSAGLPVNRGVLVDDSMRTEDPADLGDRRMRRACRTMRRPGGTLLRPGRGRRIRYIGPGCALRSRLRRDGPESSRCGRLVGGRDRRQRPDRVERLRQRTNTAGSCSATTAWWVPCCMAKPPTPPWYLSLIKEGRPIGAARANLPFGPAFQPAEWAA